MSGATLRLDKLLWHLRLAKTRSLAQACVAEGHVRLNGKRVERIAQGVTIGDVLTIPLGNRVRVIQIVALPARRGPATEAQGCYRALDGGLDGGAQLAIASESAEPTADPLGDPRP